MRKLIPILMLLLCLNAGAQNVTLIIPLANMQITPATNRTVQIQAFSVPTVSSGAVVIGDLITMTSDTNGNVTLTNVPNYCLYGVKVLGPPSFSQFMLYPTNSGGTVYAYNCMVASSTATFPAGTVAWAAATSDLRYAPIGQTITNAVLLNGTNVYSGTNIFLLPVVVSNSLTLNGVTITNWPGTFQAMTNLNGLTNASQTFATGTSGSNFNIVSAAGVHTFNLPQATPTNSGYLSYLDFITFSNKQASLGSTNPVPNTRNVNTTSPLSGGGALSSDLTISMTQSGSGTNGWLSSTDWNTFNGKQASLGFTPAPASRLINTSSPLGGGGNLSNDLTLTIQQANGSQGGYLSSSDWNTFNNKQPGLGFTAPITLTTTNVGITQAGTFGNGYLSSTDWNTFNLKQNGSSTLSNWATVGTNLVAYVSALGTSAYSNAINFILSMNGNGTNLTIVNSTNSGTWLYASGASSGYVWTSDGNGNGSWQAATGGSGGGIPTLNGKGTNTALISPSLTNGTVTTNLTVIVANVVTNKLVGLILTNPTPANASPLTNQDSPALVMYNQGAFGGGYVSALSIQSYPYANGQASGITIGDIQNGTFLVGDASTGITLNTGGTSGVALTLAIATLKISNFTAGPIVPFFDSLGVLHNSAVTDYLPQGTNNLYYATALVYSDADQRYIRHAIQKLTNGATLATNNTTMLCDTTTGGSFTFNLPVATSTTNWVVMVNIGTNNLIVKANGTDNVMVEGTPQQTYTNSTYFRSDILQSDGVNKWWLLASHVPGTLSASNNLSDVGNTATALANLGGVSSNAVTNIIDGHTNLFVYNTNGFGTNLTVKATGSGTNVSLTIPIQSGQSGYAVSVVSNGVTQFSVSTNGATFVQAFQMTNGATLNYVLTSDGSGNGTWLPSGGGSANTNAWVLGGNSGTASSNFLGTTDNQPMRIKVNTAGAVLFQTALSPGAVDNIFDYTQGNAISTAAGQGNTLFGENNTMTGSDVFENTIISGDNNAFGGLHVSRNLISGNNNTISGTSIASSAAIGEFNVINGGGSYSLALGNSSVVNQGGCFVWSSGGTGMSSAIANSFIIGAPNGVGINTNNPGTNALSVFGSVLITNGNIRIQDNAANGYVLQSDANGVGTWKPNTGTGIPLLNGSGTNTSFWGGNASQIPLSSQVQSGQTGDAFDVITNGSTVEFGIRSNGTVGTYNSQITAGLGQFYTVANVNLTGQTSAISSNNIYTNVAAPALYQLNGIVLCTTASGSGSPTLSVQVGFQDEAGTNLVTAISGLSLSAMGRTAITPITLSCTNSTPVYYQTTIASAAGSPQYSVKIVLTRLQ